jgi:hypothetical protein
MNMLRRLIVVTMTGFFALAFVLPVGKRVFVLPSPPLWVYGVSLATVAASWPLLVLGSRLSERQWRRAPQAV